MTEALRIERQGSVTFLSLSRPPDNLLDPAMVGELRSACEAIHDEPYVRAVVVTGDGACFSAGWDADTTKGETPADSVDLLRSAGMLDDPLGFLQNMRQPVIAAINGDALGAGLALALSADVCICSDGASFGLPEVKDGAIPVGGVLARLARIAGRGTAMRMALTGEPIPAAEALRSGLVSEVVAKDAVLGRAHELATRIAERGPLAVQYAKEAVTRGLDMPLEQALRYETDLTIILQTTEDRAEGVRAFQEKAKPVFRGE